MSSEAVVRLSCAEGRPGSERSDRPEIAVVHLIRAVYGVAPFRDFIQSYNAHRAGVPHELVLLCKGFDGGELPAEWIDVLGDAAACAVFMPDTGMDIDSYFEVAELLSHGYLCFVNTWSRILANDWLAKLYRHVRGPDVGVVGATGAWFSLYTTNVMYVRRQAQLSAATARTESELEVLRPHFPPFPNPYIRTNGFLIARSLFSSLRGTGATKIEALLFELGADSMTRQLIARNLKALVVGRDGRAYEPEAWPASRTFRSWDQENLLVSDNRTEIYARAVGLERDALAWTTWGDAACDAEPTRMEDLRPLELDRTPPDMPVILG